MPDPSPAVIRATPPLVSVVIPCHNHAHFLGEAIESVLAQSHRPLEVIVIDDGSTDNSVVVATRYPEVLVQSQRRGGLPAARNAGLRRARGEYVMFLDSDDCLLPGAVLTGLAWLEPRPECVFVSGNHRIVGVERQPLGDWNQSVPAGDPYVELLRRNYISMGATVLFRRASLLDAGGFDEQLDAAEDYELYLRIARAHPVLAHDTVVAEYRRTGRSMSDSHARMLRTSVTVLRRQRQFVAGNAERRAAYKAGLRAWRLYYGGLLVAQIRELRLNGGSVRAVCKGLAALGRFAPLQLLALVGVRGASAR